MYLYLNSHLLTPKVLSSLGDTQFQPKAIKHNMRTGHNVQNTFGPEVLLCKHHYSKRDSHFYAPANLQSILMDLCL